MYPESSIAELYIEAAMPKELRTAYQKKTLLLCAHMGLIQAIPASVKGIVCRADGHVYGKSEEYYPLI